MVRFSYGLAPGYPAGEALELVKAADGFDFYGCYLGDDVTLRDTWVIAGAAARETGTIRIGFSATHAYLREPSLIAQGLATLDELSGGRVEAAIGLGGLDTLDRHHVVWRGHRPLARMREAIAVIRALLDEGEVTFDGEFFRYSGVVIGVLPVQERVPLLIGALGGPQTFRLAGAIGDGIHCAGVDRDNSTYVVEQVRQGALEAGRDPAGLDHAVLCPIAVSEDGSAAREALRTLMAGWITSMPRNLIERLAIDPNQVDRIATALAEGDMVEALRLTPPEVATTLGVTGTPEECLQQIRTELVESGIDHIIMGITDPQMVEGITGIKIDGVPSVTDQMRLVHDHVIPAFPSSSDVST